MHSPSQFIKDSIILLFTQKHQIFTCLVTWIALYTMPKTDPLNGDHSPSNPNISFTSLIQNHILFENTPTDNNRPYCNWIHRRCVRPYRSSKSRQLGSIKSFADSAVAPSPQIKYPHIHAARQITLQYPQNHSKLPTRQRRETGVKIDWGIGATEKTASRGQVVYGYSRLFRFAE